MRVHVLCVPSVLSHVSKMQKKGDGKHRAWCGYCSSLKDNRRFHWCVFASHPDSETGLYYGPYGEWVCADCLKKNREKWRMPKREYLRRLRATIRGLEP